MRSIDKTTIENGCFKVPLLILEANSINTKSFVHDKSSSTSQLIKSKSSDLQKLIRYFRGITISTFKVGTRGGGGESACPGIPGCEAQAGVFSIISVLYLSDLSFKASLSTSSVLSL